MKEEETHLNDFLSRMTFDNDDDDMIETIENDSNENDSKNKEEIPQILLRDIGQIEDVKDMLDFLLSVLRNWENDNYKGMVVEELPTVVNENTTKDYPKTLYGFEDYMKDYNTEIDIENQRNFEKVLDVFDDYELGPINSPDGSSDGSAMRYILQIGFGNPSDTIQILNRFDDFIVITISEYHDHVWNAKKYMDEKYPGRHILLLGELSQQLKNVGKIIPYKFSLVFLHSHMDYYTHKLTKLVIPFLEPSSMIIYDRVRTDHFDGLFPYTTIVYYIHKKILSMVEKVGEYMIMCPYDDNVEDDIDFKKIESNFPIFMLETVVAVLSKDFLSLQNHLPNHKNQGLIRQQNQKKQKELDTNLTTLEKILSLYLDLQIPINGSIYKQLIRDLNYDTELLEQFTLNK